MRVLLVGLGRMGQRYLNVLNDSYGSKLELYTVDPRENGRVPKTHFRSLQEVPTVDFDLAIDAHPNEGRLELLQAFCQRQVPKVILEKPHASSMTEIKEMGDFAQRLSVKIMLPFYRYFLPELQLKTFEKLGAGQLIGMNTTSGAIGFGCNGVHYIELASRMLGGSPHTVLAQLGTDKILSPRGAQFLDHEGTMILNYPKGKYVISIDANSSIGASTTFIFENGKIHQSELPGINWTWWRRPEESMTLPMTRTSMEKEIVPLADYNLNLEKLIFTGISEFMAGRNVPSLVDGNRALKTIALAMASSKLERKVQWSEEDLIADTKFAFT